MKTKNKKIIFLFFLFLFISFFCLGKNSLADIDFEGLMITEIMYNPTGSNSDHSKWVELFNSSSEKIVFNTAGSKTASGWKIDKLKLMDSSNHYFYSQENNPIEISPGEFLIVTDNVNNFIKDYPDSSDNIVLKSAITLTSGSSWNLSLYEDSNLLDVVAYYKTWGADDNGMSLEKIELFGDNEQENWRESCVLGGTPGQENSTEDDCPEPEPDPDEDEEDEIEEDIEDDEKYEGGNYNIRLNEILPNPNGDEGKGEYIEIYNGEAFAINLKDWILKDSSKTKLIFSEDYIIKSGEYLTIYRDVFKFALNNSGKESVSLLDPDENVISMADYEGAKEEMSYGFDGAKWIWSKYQTPSKENKFSSAPKVKIKKIESGYMGMPVYFEVDVKSKDKDEFKYRWDFDDGARSYLQNVNHTFKKEGKYKVKLFVDDGAAGVEKSFSIKIKKYPKVAVEITRLFPNPKGNDTGEEWLEVKNNSPKEINLKGWKIATGQKNLINHSIADDLKIIPGTTFQITRENALFFLNNKEAQIELRYPNGKTAAKISYKKDKIGEDEICRNKGGVCEWIIPDEEDEEDVDEGENEKEVEVAKEDELMEDVFAGEDLLSFLDENLMKENEGKFSYEENVSMDKIYKISLAKDGAKNNLVIDLNNGKGFVYQLDNNYHFTPSFYQTHWAVDFLEDIKAKILLNGN